ncbi:unnamed protein product [Ceratitis capitata]|uniref:(Mediterranean fruit fly) hypothetical protein n=1 Tax=Ceratitis capitata TaxID=7213 RepID=A0A811UZZ9_CERCA|nr:unnamed protein product [Ceratitis capitata]
MTADGECRFNTKPPLLVIPVAPVSTSLTIIVVAVVTVVDIRIGVDTATPPIFTTTFAYVPYLCTQYLIQ